jgi:hypothetical protein
LELADERKSIKRQLMQSSDLRPSYNRLTHKIRASINKDYEQWCNNNCEEVERYQHTNQTRSLHKKIREITNGISPKTSNVAIKDKKGAIITAEADVRKRWAEYCGDLYNYDINTAESTLAHLWTGQMQEPEVEISLAETEAAVLKLKSLKSPGIDGVAGELIKYGGIAALHSIHHICQKAWSEEKFPELWTKSVIVTIPKKGDLKLCENYRTISLIVHSSKVLLEIIRRRLKPHIDTHLAEEQAGFRTGRSTVEQIFTWRQLAERYMEAQNGELVNVFIDFKKAFDRVWHTGLLRVLEHYNIPRKIIMLISDLYGQAVSAVKIGADVSDWFQQTVGVRQGCILSPDLFNIFLEHVLCEALEAYKGGALINGRLVSNLKFADDIDLMGTTDTDAQSILDAVHKSSEQYGLEINREKTKVMLTSRTKRSVSLHIDQCELEQVTHFKYLGSEVTEDNDTTRDVRCRTAQALSAMGRLKQIWKNSRVTLTTKLRMFDCLVKPIALYGCEAWVMKKANREKLQAFEMKCMRILLNVTWRDHITNNEIAVRTSRRVGHIVDVVLHRQRTWLGHVLRMNGNRLPKMSLQAYQIGTRYRGRPRMSWADAALEGSGVQLKSAIHLAQDRETWRDCMSGANDLKRSPQ